MPSRPLPRHLHKALDRLQAEPEGAWTLDRLAAICHVAPRTLQKHFRRFLSRTPVKFVRELRLERARQQLLRPTPTTMVSDVAAGCGFNHLGRFAGWYRRRYGETPSATLQRCQPTLGDRTPLPVLSSALERPAIAVLPFAVSGTNTSAAGALADEIAAALCRLHWIRVTTVDNARYRLRGRLVGDTEEGLRVTALLTDASAQRIIWADHWTGDRNDLVAFEERVAAGIARAIQPVLRDAEMDQASRGQPGELRAWGLTMRALSSVYQYEPAALGMALELLERAMELAPHDALPTSVAAWCHGVRAGLHFTPRPNVEKERARALAVRAARLNTGDPLAETMLAAGYGLSHDLTAAEVHIERALTLDRTSPWAWGSHAWAKAYRGQANEAIECFQIARAIAPFDRLHFLCCHGIGGSMFDAGRYEESVAWYSRGVVENPAALWMNRWLVAAYVLAGRKDEGRHTLAELRKADPELTIADVRSGLPWHSDFLDRVADGLESAGLHP